MIALSRRTVSLALLAAFLLTVSPAQAERISSARALGERDVVSRCAAYNPNVRASLLELESERWNVYGEESRYVPVVQLDSSATQSTTPTLGVDVINTTRTRRADVGMELRKRMVWGTELSLRLGSNWQVAQFDQGFAFTPAGKLGPAYGVLAKFSLKQPLLRGRGTAVGEASLVAARMRRTSAQYARDRVASEVLRDALTAYWELWYAHAALGIQQRARVVAQRQHAQALARADAGALAVSGVLPFETQVSARGEDVANARVLRRQRELELLSLLGAVEDRQGLELDVDSVPTFKVEVRDALERRALLQSAQLLELENALQLLRVQTKTAADAQRSRLDLDAYVQTQGLANDELAPAARQAVNLRTLSAFVGVTYESPVNHHAYRAAAARARLSVEVAQQRLLAQRQRVLSEVNLALERQAASEERVRLAEQTAEIAARQLTAEEARFGSGASTPLAVLEAQEQSRAAELRVARARTDFVTSSLALQHHTGDLLTRYAQLAHE